VLAGNYQPWYLPRSTGMWGIRLIVDHHIFTGTIGHVAHGKSTVVKAISGVQTVRFKNELVRNITIKLGYANAKVMFLRPFYPGGSHVDLAVFLRCRFTSAKTRLARGLDAIDRTAQIKRTTLHANGQTVGTG